jgi:hypothetical protein
MDEEISTFKASNAYVPVYEGEDDNTMLTEDVIDTDKLILDNGSMGESEGSSAIVYEHGVDESHVRGSELSPEIIKSLVVFNEESPIYGSCEDIRDTSDTSDDTSSLDIVDDIGTFQNEDKESFNELQSRIILFEDRLADLQAKLDKALESNGILLSSLGNDLQKRADGSELNQLKKDFDQFSKKLRRVVQAEDSVNAEALDATKVPPDVLEITYAKTLNDLYSAMLGIYGDCESSDMVENARDNVRQFSAGVDFFRFENDTFIVRGLSEAIAAKIVSVKQIHGTYIELFKMLFQYVPNYNSQDFRAFVETGSREYTIEKVVSHETSIDRMLSDISTFRDEISNITENVSFIAELQNNQIEEMEGKYQEFTTMREQMKSIAKAVNLHTKAINKLNKTLIDFQHTSGSKQDISNIIEAPDLKKIEEMVVSKASKEEITIISDEMESFKTNVESMFASIQQQLEENMLSSRELKGIEGEFSRASQMTVTSNGIDVQEDLHLLHDVEKPQPVRLADLPIEEVITSQLSVLGSATLKQLEKQITEQGFSIDFEKLSLVMSYLEQEELVNSTKKGRYTFYFVTDPVNL